MRVVVKDRLDKEFQESVAMLKKVTAEFLYVVFVIIGVATIAYDYSVTRDYTISAYVHRWTHDDPVIALAAGVILIVLIHIICIFWDFKFRYAFALAVFFFCMGHLFWAFG